MKLLLILLALPLTAQTVPEALAFLEKAEKELLAASNYAQRARWLGEVMTRSRSGGRSGVAVRHLHW